MTSRAANGSGDPAPNTGRRLPRSRSAEDLSREQLKTTENDTVIIFIEYVRKKLGTTTPRTAELDEAIERERRQRESRLRGGKSKEGKKKQGTSLRRLQSEPNGPKNPELWKHADNEQAADELQPPTETERPTRLVLQDPPSGKGERRKNRKSSSSTNKRSASTTTSAERCKSTNGPDSSSGATTPARATPVAIPIPDPPLSPCCDNTGAAADFVSSYPPPSSHRLRTAPSPVATLQPVVTGAPISQEHFCIAQQVFSLRPTLLRLLCFCSLRSFAPCLY